jgi:SHS2 domain-containing protein
VRPYEYFEHTADIGLRAYGTDLAEVFANAARGLSALMVQPATVRPRQERQVTLPGGDLTELLVEWLNEILFLVDSEGFLVADAVVQEASERGLRATLRGEPADPARHRLLMGVKAATYHQVQVRCDQGCLAQVILDV